MNPSHQDYIVIKKKTYTIYVAQAQTICDHDKLLEEKPKRVIVRCAITMCNFLTSFEPHMQYCMGILSRYADAKVSQQKTIF